MQKSRTVVVTVYVIGLMGLEGLAVMAVEMRIKTNGIKDLLMNQIGS